MSGRRTDSLANEIEETSSSHSLENNDELVLQECRGEESEIKQSMEVLSNSSMDYLNSIFETLMKVMENN